MSYNPAAVNQGDVLSPGGIIMPKTSGVGIKVDQAVPTFGWRDLTAEIQIRGAGGTDPAFNIYRGGIRQFQFDVGEECFLEFHQPHDWVPGTDMHIHFHWSHIATTVTGGTVTWGAEATWARGFNQAAFQAPITKLTPGNASATQYQHIVSESQITAAAPAVDQIDTDNLEVDGIWLVRAYLQANAMTLSGGPVIEPFLHFVDLHYQSNGMATKNKAPSFYA